MADYQDIRGLRVKYLSADPTVTVGGQVWYNSTTGTLKSRLITEAWSSGAAIATARSAMAGGGSPTAAWIAGGRTNNGPTNVTTDTTEEYNGYGWSAGGTMPQGSRSYGEGAGPLTAGITVGGAPTTPTVGQTWVESYNGTSWSAETALPTGILHNSVFGLESAAVSAGRGPGLSTPQVFNYDGGTWTIGGVMNMPRGYTTSAGTQSAGWIAGGWDDGGPPYNADEHEQYDGSSWTVAPVLNTGRSGGGGNGTQTSGIYFGGLTYPTSTAATETFDGSSWSTSPATMGTAVDEMGSANNGTSNSTALSAGGLVNNAHPQQNLTEEFNRATTVITAGAWAAGGNMNTGRRGICSAKNATQDAALGALGYTTTSPPNGTGVTNAETYDGSTWSNITAVPTSRYFGGGFGTQGAAVIVGGYSTVPSVGQKDITNEWNGSAWSLGGTLPAGQSNFAADGCGTETAGLVAGGIPGPYTVTAEYDGSSWTAVPGSLNSPRTAGASFGVQTAAIAATGDIPSGYPLTSESYDGSAWTATNPTIYGGYGAAAAGTQTAGLHAGNAPPGGTTSQTWDGTNWSTNPSYTTARYEMGGTGSSTAALGFSGATTSPTNVTNATEEFTGPTSAANIVTLTTS